MKPPRKVAHVSMDASRRRFSAREEAFARLWENENVPRRGFSFGFGILQDLMFRKVKVGTSAFYDTQCRHAIRNVEAAIVATVVQWLATNVGWCFLERALKSCGYLLVQYDPEPHNAWVRTEDRLPTESRRYIVRTRRVTAEHYYVSTSNSEADFLVGTVAGSKGLWTSYTNFGGAVDVEWWLEPEKLDDWRGRPPYRPRAP